MAFIFHVDQGRIIGASIYPVRDRFQFTRTRSTLNIHGPVKWFAGHTYASIDAAATQIDSNAAQGVGIGALICHTHQAQSRTPTLTLTFQLQHTLTVDCCCYVVCLCHLIQFTAFRPRCSRWPEPPSSMSRGSNRCWQSAISKQTSIALCALAFIHRNTQLVIHFRSNLCSDARLSDRAPRGNSETLVARFHLHCTPARSLAACGLHARRGASTSATAF